MEFESNLNLSRWPKSIMSFTNKADIGVALTIWNSNDMKVLLRTIERQKTNKQ